MPEDQNISGIGFVGYCFNECRKTIGVNGIVSVNKQDEIAGHCANAHVSRRRHP